MKTVLHILLFFAAQAVIIGFLLPIFFRASSEIAVITGFVILWLDIVWLLGVICQISCKNYQNSNHP